MARHTWKILRSIVHITRTVNYKKRNQNVQLSTQYWIYSYSVSMCAHAPLENAHECVTYSICASLLCYARVARWPGTTLECPSAPRPLISACTARYRACSAALTLGRTAWIARSKCAAVNTTREEPSDPPGSTASQCPPTPVLVLATGTELLASPSPTMLAPLERPTVATGGVRAETSMCARVRSSDVGDSCEPAACMEATNTFALPPSASCRPCGDLEVLGPPSSWSW